MPAYQRRGSVPPKRHARFPLPNGQWAAEEVFGTEGFSGNYSILYHLASPAQARAIERGDSAAPVPWRDAEQRHYHLRTGRVAAGGDPVS
jgi:homogentisate 1,2-dioxygenase